jgi:hypothetical protein
VNPDGRVSEASAGESHDLMSHALCERKPGGVVTSPSAASWHPAEVGDAVDGRPGRVVRRLVEHRHPALSLILPGPRC